MANRVTSRGVLWEVIAPVVRWPLHSPMRLLLVVVATVAVLCMIGSVSRSVDGNEGKDSSASASSSSSSDGTSSSDPSSSSSSDGTSPSSSSSSAAREDSHWSGVSEEERARTKPAVKVADRLSRDFVTHRGSTKAKWWAAISPSLSESGKKQLKQKSPKSVGFAKVTGKPGLFVSDVDMGDQYTNVAVPTDKGTFLFLVESTGKTWKVASVSRMTPGDVTTETEGA